MCVFMRTRTHVSVYGGRISHQAWREQVGCTSWLVSPRSLLVSAFPARGLQECDVIYAWLFTWVLGD